MTGPAIDAADLARLGAVVDALREAYEVAAANLAEAIDRSGLDCSPLQMRDAQGRYILADMLAAYGNAYATWVNLRAAANATAALAADDEEASDDANLAEHNRETARKYGWPAE
jgi:hypothetical protein